MNPWPNIINNLAKEPKLLKLKSKKSTTPIWTTEEYATKTLTSLRNKQIILENTKLVIEKRTQSKLQVQLIKFRVKLKP